MRPRRALVLLLVAMAVTGCAITPYRAHPDAARRLPTLKRLALMPPDVKVYSLSAGGVPELMDDWSERGRRNAADAVRRALTAHDGTYVLRDFAPDATDPRLTQQFEDVRALVDAIRSTTILHTYNPNLMIEEKLQNFRYSVGPVPDLAEAADADALVFVSGVDHISTGGRKALMVLGLLVGGVTGVYAGPVAGVSQMTVVVVEPRTGDVLWFNVAGAGGNADLRDPDSVGPLAATLLQGFGGSAPQP